MKLNEWISSSQAKEMHLKQLETWELARTNFRTLERIEVKQIEVGDFKVRIQYTPSRLLSSNAKIDLQSLTDRKCFLCPDNQPVEQMRLPFGLEYYVLCNPYPIFLDHFTIAARHHIDQQLLIRLRDFLELARRLDDFTIFYNGPKSGASAPDHAHFQAVTRGVMPLDNDWKRLISEQGKRLIEKEDGSLYQFTHYLRNGFIVRAASEKTAIALFERVYQALDKKPDEIEPRMNVFCQYNAGDWVIIVVPRKIHRPAQFFLEEPERILTSPGGADIGGLYITARKEDFDKITPAVLTNIYEQVCYSDSEIEKLGIEIGNSVK